MTNPLGPLVLVLTASDLRAICGIRNPRRGLAADKCVVLPDVAFSTLSHIELRGSLRLNEMARQGDIPFPRCRLLLRLSPARMPHMPTDLMARRNAGDHLNLTTGCHEMRVGMLPRMLPRILPLSLARMPRMPTVLMARHSAGDHLNLTIGCHAMRT